MTLRHYADADAIRCRHEPFITPLYAITPFAACCRHMLPLAMPHA